jgi:hypothetical protein
MLAEAFVERSRRLMRRQSRALLRRWWRWWYSPTAATRRRWLGDCTATDNTLKAWREESIRVADHRRSVLNRVPVRAVGVRHPVTIGERDLRPHATAWAVAGLHVGHVRVRSRVAATGAANNRTAAATPSAASKWRTVDSFEFMPPSFVFSIVRRWPHRRPCYRHGWTHHMRGRLDRSRVAIRGRFVPGFRVELVTRFVNGFVNETL